jgi:hypothetical protein
VIVPIEHLRWSTSGILDGGALVDFNLQKGLNKNIMEKVAPIIAGTVASGFGMPVEHLSEAFDSEPPSFMR